MKKWLSALLIAFLTVGILAACAPEREQEANSDSEENNSSAEGEMPEKPEKLVIWEDKDKGVALEPAIKSFEEEHGIKVEFKELDMSSKMREQLRLDGPAGTGPDVLTLPHDQIGQLVIEGLISPLEYEQSVTDKYTEASVKAETYDGKLYGLPKATETPVFIYNKEHMDQAPETFEEVFEFSKDFTQDEQYGFLALWDNFYFANSVMSGYGGYVFGEENGSPNPQDLGLSNEGAIEGADYIQKWYEEIFPAGIVGESGGSAKDGLFQDGKVASMMDGPWAFQALNEAGIDYGVAPLPKLPNGEYPQTFVGVKGWHLSSASENKEWASELIKWIANEENAKIRFEETNEIPPIQSLIEDPIIADDERANAVAVQSERAIPMPNIPEMSEVWEPMAQALQLIATGKSSPEDALNEATETISKQIELNHSGNE
ncbi:cyclodextrin-binding protein [Halobacillus halophilus]|uniref:ABC-type transport system extracellular binding protein (Probable substrate maltose/maltodextrin) n=1 Tax=Halobacillus halophilus (strain ATCC 35676 / DSM 2266 / JCM 20832 / KCTC 3685 / LMG 17431 / NBRC 102448 / NCIMB 2269) TaxID=866895 RepID=I0JQN7_HALH3|nr:extracellular solute-binding protein [Halobacillus halophilus]ASF40468.1 cyclodextrin-binding protein [Halobacillus halophilus]CCG46457.1 ABC-type transport system extracellular binding protein (probable substrate maltose/maltodextrin) [Halobacillus halophilus DSM 2266]